MKMMRVLMISLLCMILLCGCSELVPGRGQNLDIPSARMGGTAAQVPEETEPVVYDTVEQLTLVVTEKSIEELEKYPNLKKVDLSDSTCYAAIQQYMERHPEVEVTYSVDFGGAEAVNWVERISLNADGVQYGRLLRNLKYLPKLKTVHLPKTKLTEKEISMLRFTFPDIQFTYTVDFQGRELDPGTVNWNASGITRTDFDALISAAEQLPNLELIELMDANGSCSLTAEEFQQLKQMAPQLRFHYAFDLFGRRVSSADEKIVFEKLKLTKADEPEIRRALQLMGHGSTLVLDRCGLDDELLASIREDYSDVDLVWRVYFGVKDNYNELTNTETLRCVYNVTDETCEPMKYLRSVRYMDLGHNDTLTDLSFLGYMPDLEICILSGCAASDLSGIEKCKKLEFLELANCQKMADLSPLEGCTNLKYLNLCYTKVSSLTPLEELPIQNLFCKQTRVNAAEQNAFKEAHSSATAVFTGKEAYAGPGWRYTDNGYTYTDFYKRVREVFDLDAVDKVLRAQEQAQQG